MRIRVDRLRVSTVIAISLLMVAHGARAQEKVTAASTASTQVTTPPVIVYGAVRSPSRIELRRRARLAELIALAGGVTKQAGKTVNVVHTEAESNCSKRIAGSQKSKVFEEFKLAETLAGDQNANPYICAGDVVIVMDADPV